MTEKRLCTRRETFLQRANSFERDKTDGGAGEDGQGIEQEEEKEQEKEGKEKQEQEIDKKRRIRGSAVEKKERRGV